MPELGEIIAEEINSRVCIHSEEPGGQNVLIIGQPGCGKTTALQWLAQKMFYYNQMTGKFQKETVIWRARLPRDFWNYFLLPDFEWEDPRYKREVVVHYHKAFNSQFVLETGPSLDLSHVPLRPYDSAMGLIHHIVPGAINVVYEPRVFRFKKAFVKRIEYKAMRPLKQLDRKVDGTKFWFEFYHTLMQTKGTEFYTIFMDEADEVFLDMPCDADWHLTRDFRESLRDFRKAGVTSILTFHTWGDISHMITSKYSIFGWMRGRIPPQWSQVSKYYKTLFTLPVGRIVWEGAGFGWMNFPKIAFRPRVMKVDSKKYGVREGSGRKKADAGASIEPGAGEQACPAAPGQ